MNRGQTIRAQYLHSQCKEPARCREDFDSEILDRLTASQKMIMN